MCAFRTQLEPLRDGHYVYLPIPPVISRAREVDPGGAAARAE